MKQLNYQEIFFTSSEHGIFSGNAGFGVRTCTKGMDSMDVDKIMSSCATGYAVYNDRVLDMDRILANPDVVYDYPPTYIFRIIELNDGSKKYVFGRTVYLGVDYGFFKEINANDRTGTNYITHLLVFSEKPTISIFRDLLSTSSYIPLNYSCSSSNTELKELLTGVPEYLPEKSFDFSDEVVKYSASSDTLPFILGVVQMLKNRDLPTESDMPRKMYVKCPGKKVERCLESLDMFPEEAFDEVQYLTNYMQGYGIPDGYDIAFVNEYNEMELYEDNNITVDMFSGSNKNIKENYFVTKIGLLIQQGEMETASRLIRFYLKLKDVSEKDYEFYYSIFLGVESDKQLSLDDLTDSTIKKLPGLKLNQPQNDIFWGKVSKAVNEGLTSTQGNVFLHAVDKLKEIMMYCPGKIQIQEESVNFVTNILFSGRGNFGKIAKEENISVLLRLANKSLISSEELFLASLGESSDEKVWEESLSFYYEGLDVERDKILTAIIHSTLSEKDTDKLLLFAFPLPLFADTLFDFFKNNPSDAIHARSTVSSLVVYYGEKRFSDFIWLGHIEPELTKIASPIIANHYKKCVAENVKKGTLSLISFLEKVGCDQLDELNLWDILKIGAQKYLTEPLKDIEAFLLKIQEIGVPLHEHIEAEIKMLICLANHTIPDYANVAFLEAAIKDYPGDNRYIVSLFAVWLRNKVRIEELKDFVSKNKKNISNSSFATFIKIIWEYPTGYDSKEKEKMVLTVIDNCGWDRKMVEKFCQMCGIKELEKMLLKSNGLFNRTMRTLFKH